MGRIVYISLILFLSIIAQIFSGNLGLVIPLLTLCIFYITVIFNWESGIISSVISGIAVDLLYGRTFFVSPFINIASVLLAMVWLHKGELKILSIQMIPGAIISIIYIVPFVYMTYQQSEHGFVLVLENIGIIISSALISTLLFPCIIKFLDMINNPLGFNYYKTSQERLSQD